MRALWLISGVVWCACSAPTSSVPDSGEEDAPPAPRDSGVVVPPPDAGDAPSHGGTITFERIGATGWYPTRTDPATGTCDAYSANGCCLNKKTVTSDQLTPWDEDLIVTLRGPMLVQRFAVYQPSGGDWSRVSSWTRASNDGIAFDRDDFDGAIGTECLVNVSSAAPFSCGSGSSPFCTAARAYEGWRGSKLFVFLARMPPASEVPGRCSNNDDGNWFDAPWVGLSLGELIRAGAFGSCHCYSRNPTEWWLGDGCGQFNAFEVVNDRNSFKNLSVFSTNFFGYGGYVGEGPCGAACDVSALGPEVDLIDKQRSVEAQRGAVASPGQGPRAAFRRPIDGFRYFVMLFDVPSRTVQLALLHPGAVPSSLSTLLPALPESVDAATVESVRTLRLPQ